ncbi:MAG: hypothetical protein K8S56_10695 [Candidatus Cloacimonetes bacterium]|nr:hypothetical protein [Candidatus Cloacimonadota bacterium]
MKKKSNFNQMRPKGIYDNVLKQRELDGIAFYDRNHKKFVDIKCPACGSSGDELFIKYGFNHRKCSNCETIYCSPRPTEKLLLEYYNTYDAPKMWTDLLLTADEKRKKIQYHPRAIEIVRQLKKEGAQRGVVALYICSVAGTFALCLKETRFFSAVIGMDFISVSSLRHREIGRSAHKSFLKLDILLIEDMSLSVLNSSCEIKEVIALPLRFSNADGAPCTVIGYEE